jgi:hypothetical protein
VQITTPLRKRPKAPVVTGGGETRLQIFSPRLAAQEELKQKTANRAQKAKKTAAKKEKAVKKKLDLEPAAESASESDDDSTDEEATLKPAKVARVDEGQQEHKGPIAGFDTDDVKATRLFDEEHTMYNEMMERGKGNVMYSMSVNGIALQNQLLHQTRTTELEKTQMKTTYENQMKMLTKAYADRCESEKLIRAENAEQMKKAQELATAQALRFENHTAESNSRMMANLTNAIVNSPTKAIAARANNDRRITKLTRGITMMLSRDKPHRAKIGLHSVIE